MPCLHVTARRQTLSLREIPQHVQMPNAPAFAPSITGDLNSGRDQRRTLRGSVFQLVLNESCAGCACTQVPNVNQIAGSCSEETVRVLTKHVGGIEARRPAG